MTIKIDKKDQLTYKKVYINSHTLDYAINDAIQRFKSSLTNLKRKNIKHFRLRVIKLTKKDRIMKLEKSAFGISTICSSILGEVKCLNNEDDFSYLTNMSTVSVIKKYGNEYYLLKKYKFEEDNIDDDRVIGLDPGIRTVLTGYSNKDILEVGNDVSEIIKKKLKQIDSIVKKGFNKKKERAIVKRKYERIKNMTKDMHYKVSNYLTENYGNIIMGNLSTKSVGEGKGISRMTKRIGNMISFDKFKNILKYKCVRKGVNYKEMDERYTSKCCGKCGNKKDNLGGNKIYKCERCGINMGRDINSARLMIIKSEE
jgi:IS605 OrfB family transposase